ISHALVCTLCTLFMCFFYYTLKHYHIDAFSFVFDTKCDIRAQHPVPTRRSSDLAEANSSTSLMGWRFFLSVAFLIEVTIWAQGLDRKSTRLNSSHVSISYAVFCLKKKPIGKIVNNYTNCHHIVYTKPLPGNSFMF